MKVRSSMTAGTLLMGSGPRSRHLDAFFRRRPLGRSRLRLVSSAPSRELARFRRAGNDPGQSRLWRLGTLRGNRSVGTRHRP
jgi:hypothetical protein